VNRLTDRIQAGVTANYCRDRNSSFESDYLVEKNMGIDVRLPIETLLSLLGLVLAAYGTLADTSRYKQSMGANSSLAWGVVSPVFGLIILMPDRRGMRVAPQKSNSHSSEPTVR
jgi:hypothetical protein